MVTNSGTGPLVLIGTTTEVQLDSVSKNEKLTTPFDPV